MEHRFSSVQQVRDSLKDVNYLADDGIAGVAFLADRLAKPILVEGPAGTGKTQLAKSVAEMLGARLIRLQCYEGLDAAQAIYEWNYQRQLLSIRAASEDGVTGKAVEDRIFSRDFLLERPLLAAITQEAPPVLLIDEIDRADEEFEAYLLEVLSDFQISIPELGTITATTRPIVILTSNGTRDLSDALRRRCLYTYVAYPERATELAILKARCPEVDVRLGEQIVGFVQKLRGEDLEKTPGIAEMLDFAAALMGLGIADLTADPAVLQSTLTTLLKTQSDKAQITPEVAGRIAGKAA